MKRVATVVVLVLMLVALPTIAHHSYAMFDSTKHLTVKGSVAKLEWSNPHTYVWVYVGKKAKPTEFDLYGFENAPPSMMSRIGWTKTSLKAGDKVWIEYLPLKDGRNGGYLTKATLADGRVLAGDPLAVNGAAAGGRTPEGPTPQKQ